MKVIGVSDPFKVLAPGTHRIYTPFGRLILAVRRHEAEWETG